MEELVLLAGVVWCDKRKKSNDYGSISAKVVLVVLLEPLKPEVLIFEYVNAQNFKHGKTAERKKELSQL